MIEIPTVATRLRWRAGHDIECLGLSSEFDDGMAASTGSCSAASKT